MSIKKILLATRPLTPPWDEASKNFAYFLAKSIKDPELQMNILTTSTPLDGLGDNVVSHPIFPLYDASRAGHSFSQKVILSKYLFTESHRYDIVHYLFTPTALNSALIRNFTYRRPKTVQTIATLREDLYGPKDWKKMLFADRIVTYSDYSKRKLEANGFTGIERIYPGIDLDLYAPKPKNEEALKHFDLTREDVVVMYPGEYVRLGATDMLVEMLITYLKSQSSDCHPELVEGSSQIETDSSTTVGMTRAKTITFIFGCRIKNEADQKKKDEVVAKLTQAGIIDCVRFTDTWKDMPTLYNLSDIVIFPVENMRGKFDIPLAIIEAYACGKPVILSDLEIFQEFSSPEFSVTIPLARQSLSEGGRTLWQTILDLQSDESKRKRLGTNARTFTEQFFDLKNTAQSYERLYASLQ
ncbi:MAG: glycosyltransferase family 4 protein [Candidatus Moranbacteria bacterium]|nr:glycosyltransferase family 4 protein [Candidatus Moranbacteria bacterium]